MLLVIPEIEIINGKCSYCIKSDRDMIDYYEHLSNNPNELCKLLRVENSKSIFINDIDSFNEEVNHINFDAIIELTKTIDSPFQVLINIKTFDECKYLIQNKVRKIIIKDLLFNNPSLVKDLIEEYTASFFAFYIEKKAFYTFANKNLNFTSIEIIDFIKSIGGNRIFYDNSDWSINGEGIKLDPIILKANEHKMKITLINGIYNSKQLWELEKLTEFGVDSIVLGEAFYNNYFPCQKIWRKIEADDKNLELSPVKH